MRVVYSAYVRQRNFRLAVEMNKVGTEDEQGSIRAAAGLNSSPMQNINFGTHD